MDFTDRPDSLLLKENSAIKKEQDSNKTENFDL